MGADVDEPLVDLTRTAALADPATEAGQAALVEIFRAYFDNVCAASDAMRRATAPEDVRAQAHRAKGASGIVGAVGLAALFADLEVRAAAGESVTRDVFDQIDAQLAALRRTITAWLGRDLQ